MVIKMYLTIATKLLTLEKYIKESINYLLFGYVECMYNFINKNTYFKVKLLNNHAKKPFKADPGCAGYDIFSTQDVTIEPKSRALVPTGISIEIPSNFYVRIAPRSGLSLKGVDIGAGVIDSSYRGEIKVVLINNTNQSITFESGFKIAQMILERCVNPEIEVLSELSDTSRGAGGFGSTGN
jgi:dUTP pyrophosphatase